jgi:hypothetical protein
MVAAFTVGAVGITKAATAETAPGDVTPNTRFEAAHIRAAEGSPAITSVIPPATTATAADDALDAFSSVVDASVPTAGSAIAP